MFNPLNLLSKIIKGSNQKELDRINKIVKKINILEKDVEKLNEIEFPKKTNEFIEQVKNGKKVEEILPEAVFGETGHKSVNYNCVIIFSKSL